MPHLGSRNDRQKVRRFGDSLTELVVRALVPDVRLVVELIGVERALLEVHLLISMGKHDRGGASEEATELLNGLALATSATEAAERETDDRGGGEGKGDLHLRQSPSCGAFLTSGSA